MEYQAKELFAKHDVPVTLGKTVETAEDARAAAEEIGGVVVVKAQVKAGGRGKAGGVKLAKTPEEAERARAQRSSAWRSRASPSTGCSSCPRDADRGGVLLLLPARPLQPLLPVHRLASRAASRSRRSPRPTPTPSRRSPIDAGDRRRRGQGHARSSTRPAFPAELTDQAVALVQALWKVFVEEDATLVEVNPLARLAGRQARGARRQGLARRERRVPPRGPRAVRGQGRGRPARGEGQGQGPQLRQARRLRRHHRQRRRAGHVDPRRRRVRR